MTFSSKKATLPEIKWLLRSFSEIYSGQITQIDAFYEPFEPFMSHFAELRRGRKNKLDSG